MACGIALKRPLELDPYHSPEGVKRPRTTASHCSPFRPTFLNSLASATATSLASSSQNAPSPSTRENTSPFTSLPGGSPLSRKQLESYLQAEIKILRRRRLLPRNEEKEGGKRRDYRAPHSPGNSSDSDSEHTHLPHSTRASVEEKPQFSFKQVRMICERLLKEQEDRLKQQYEEVLTTKLSEQYDQFVKFTQDQIHRQIESAPVSYLS